MSFLFNRNKQKPPQDVVRALSEALPKLESPSGDKRKVTEEVSRNLQQMKLILTGDEDEDPQPALVAALASEMHHTELFTQLVTSLRALDFAARKDVVLIFNTLLRRRVGDRSPTVDYLAQHPRIFEILILSYDNHDSALTAGEILRDCNKWEQLSKIIIWSPQLWKFFEYVDHQIFQNATDAFGSLSDIVTVHQQVAGEFLAANKEKFIANINKLMQSSNYVTRRQSLKLMGQLIRQRANYPFMTTYVNEVENLKLIMMLLKDKSKNIVIEAFNIFKLFAANPKKPRPVADVLLKNKTKLIAFLTNLETDKKDDDEKDFVIKAISSLQPIVTPGSSPSPSPQSHSPTHTSGHHHQAHTQPGSGLSMLTPAPSLPPPVVHSEPVLRQNYPE